MRVNWKALAIIEILAQLAEATSRRHTQSVKL
jgi:hypothetical protein